MIFKTVIIVDAAEWPKVAVDLRRARVRGRKSLRQFSKEVGLSCSYYSKLERGVAVPCVGSLSRIAGAVGGEFGDRVKGCLAAAHGEAVD